VDMLARYLEQLTGGGSGISEDFLKAHGYA
jgi:hypothetical protein